MLKYIAPFLSVGLLAGVSIEKADRHRVPEGVDAYHARIQESIQATP